MNAHTTITPEGNIPIPADVIERLGLKPGMDIVIDEARREIRLTPKAEAFAPDRPRTTVADLRKWPKWEGTPKPVEDISSLGDDAFREIVADQEHRARG